MERSASQYHYIGSWVAILFNPVFAITDYLNIPESWTTVLVIRIVVSLITLATLVLYRKGLVNTYVLVAVPLSLISLQNAFTYSLLEPENILTHNLNYLALFLGAGLFLLWPMLYSILAIGLSFVATMVFIYLNPALQVGQLATEGGLLLGTIAVFTILLIQARYSLRLREIRARLALNSANEQIAAMNNQLQEANAHLEEEVAIRTASLRRTNEEMDRLVYSLSHDFRTPIVNLQGLLNLAGQDLGSPQGKQLLDYMQTNVSRLDELQHDMMNYAVFWNEKLTPSSMNFRQLVETVQQQLAKTRNSKIEVDFSPAESEAWQIVSDKEKLQVVVYTILTNTIRFAKTDESARLEAALEEGKETIKISLKDYGIGISNEALPRVFDMFFRGTNKSMGAGMGLYVAKGIMTQLGGSISMESAPDEGSTVILEFPNSMGTPINVSDQMAP